jgi:ketosteroid isomerase-like protein
MPEVPAPVDAFIAAVNRHDEDSFLDAFTSDGFVDDWGREFRGRDAIKQWSDGEFIGADGTMDVQSVDVTDDGVRVVADWRSTHANGLSEFTFAVRDEAIESMTIREG